MAIIRTEVNVKTIKCHKVYIRKLRNTKKVSNFSTNILSNNYQSGEIGVIIDITHQSRKGKFVNIKENIYIYLYKNNFLKK
jgi:hypothetical protein